MKTLQTVLVLLLFVAGRFSLRAQEAPPATPPTSGFPDRVQAFAGVPFGSTLEEAKKTWQLEPIEGASAPGDPVEVFLREEESQVLGGMVAREVVYYFLRGKFYAVSFSCPDSRQTTILREALAAGYGSPARACIDANTIVWPGRHVSAQLVINASTGESRAVLFSNRLQPLYEKCLSEAAAQTAAGLSGASGR